MMSLHGGAPRGQVSGPRVLAEDSSIVTGLLSALSQPRSARRVERHKVFLGGECFACQVGILDRLPGGCMTGGKPPTIGVREVVKTNLCAVKRRTYQRVKVRPGNCRSSP